MPPVISEINAKINEDEGGGGGNSGACNIEDSACHTMAPPTPTINEPASPSIRQQVTSAFMNMRSRLVSPSIVARSVYDSLNEPHNHVDHHDADDDDDDEEEDDDDDEDESEDDDEHFEQAVDMFAKHLDQQRELERERQRRASLPSDDIEMTTMSGAVLRQKQKHFTTRPMHLNHSQMLQHQQLQQQQQQQAQEQQANSSSQMQTTRQHLLPPKARPLSISSISSAASSGSSSSSNSSSSSGIQSSLTRNSSLNYSQDFRKQSYLASIESLDGQSMIASSSSSCVNNDCNQLNNVAPKSSNQPIEDALKDLKLSNHLRDLATTRAAVLAAGESQRRSFGSPGNKLSRINRSLHASLRYDKNTAYRIHLMANAKALMNDRNNDTGLVGNNFVRHNPNDEQHHEINQRFRRYSSISRNNSSTSSDSGNPRHGIHSNNMFQCTCRSTTQFSPARNLSLASSPSSSSLVNSNEQTDSSNETPIPNSSKQQLFKQKSATLDSAICQHKQATSNIAHLQHSHQADCLYLRRPKRASAKLQQSPSSVSSHSNNSSLFRDDGFEDDLTSTPSECSSTIYHNRRQSHSQHSERHRQLFYHQNQNHHLDYNHEAGLGLLSISQRVVTEILETERSYVDDLEQIVSGYLCYLRKELRQHKELFSNLEDIYKFNKDFLFQLEECYLNPGAVAACFVENALKFDVYTHYCTMYPEVVSTLTQLMANPTTAQVLKERQLELNQSLPLGAYLLKPVQRILKYHILFKSLIKHTADDETVAEKDRELINEAFSVMTNIACHINEMKKKHEHSIRVQELQALLCGWEVSN